MASQFSPASPPRRRPPVALALGIAIVAISFAAIFFRLAQPTHPLTAAATRLTLATIVLAPYILRRMATRKIPKSALFSGAWAGVFYAIHFGAWVRSLELTSVASSVTLVTSSPLILAIVGLMTRRDRPTAALWVALGLATVGIALIGGADWSASADALKGDAFALLGAAAMAGYLWWARHQGPHLDSLAFMTAATASGSALLWGLALAVGAPLGYPHPEAVAALVASALIPQLVGHTLLTWALRHAKPVTVAMATVAEPAGSALLAWWWLLEPLELWPSVGCGITLFGVLLAIRGRSR